MKKNLCVALPGLGLLLALIGAGLGLGGDAAARSTDRHDRQIQLVSLEDSLEPFKQYFNQRQGNPRVLALISPT